MALARANKTRADRGLVVVLISAERPCTEVGASVGARCFASDLFSPRALAVIACATWSPRRARHGALEQPFTAARPRHRTQYYHTRRRRRQTSCIFLIWCQRRARSRFAVPFFCSLFSLGSVVVVECQRRVPVSGSQRPYFELPRGFYAQPEAAGSGGSAERGIVKIFLVLNGLYYPERCRSPEAAL